MDKGLGHLSPNMDARLKATPNLQLLFELEPAYRVFFRNLADTLLGRSVLPVATNTKPGRFWSDVFVSTGLPWSAFLESMLWHLAVVSVLWTVAQTWVKQVQIQQRRISQESLTYTPPPKTFPALGGRSPRVREHPRTQPVERPLRMARERNPSEMKPPDLKVAHSRRTNVMASNPSSPMPLFAPRLRESRSVPTGPASAVAPAANIDQATNRRLNLPREVAVAPAANVGAVSTRRSMLAPNAAAVPPPPDLRASTSKLSSTQIGNPQVVAPSPELASRTGISARGPASLPRSIVVTPPTSARGSGTLASRQFNSRVDLPVVPPPPSVQGVGNFSRGKSGLSLSGGSAISPAPSIRAAKDFSGTGRRSSSLPGRDMVVVPPAPSVGPGNSIGGGRTASLGGAGRLAIPPPSSLSGTNSIGGGRGGSLSAGNPQAVPPPPTISGGSATGSGRGTSMSGSGQQVLPPSSSLQDSLSSIERGAAASDAQATPPAPKIDSANVPATIELPIRVIGMAVSLPNSSYFSNYEVFIAERRIKKGDPELIKLVYESLPYQPRLSDYGMDTSKVYRLRVTRDPACDETLLQMTWPQTDEKHSGSKYATGPPALAPTDRNDLLPCYRTTADDYRRAVTQDR